jgi:hypothetical protein
MVVRKPIVEVDNILKELPIGDSLDIGVVSASAASLQLTRIASEDILSGECVKSDSVTNVSLATNNIDYTNASVLGVAANGVSAGGSVVVVLMGVIYNDIYSVFSLDAQLFLDISGGITDVRPVLPNNKYISPIGKSLGGGSIFVQIGAITKLA